MRRIITRIILLHVLLYQDYCSFVLEFDYHTHKRQGPNLQIKVARTYSRWPSWKKNEYIHSPQRGSIAPIWPNELPLDPHRDCSIGPSSACWRRRVETLSVSYPISSYIVGLCTCTVTISLNGYINICILWQEFSNWSPIYSLG